MEVAPGIHDIPTKLDTLMRISAPRVYFIAGKKGAFIDSGYGQDDIADTYIEYAKNVSKAKIDYIIITHAHPDHISGASLLTRKTGAKLILLLLYQSVLLCSQMIHRFCYVASGRAFFWQFRHNSPGHRQRYAKSFSVF